jgi:hypothetical protein
MNQKGCRSSTGKKPDEFLTQAFFAHYNDPEMIDLNIAV